MIHHHRAQVLFAVFGALAITIAAALLSPPDSLPGRATAEALVGPFATPCEEAAR